MGYINTPLRIRVQAHGGKYLGPAVPQPSVAIAVPYQPPGKPLAVPNGTSGTVTATRSARSSPYPIVVQPLGVGHYRPGTYYLDPEPPAGSGQSPLNYLDVMLSLSTDKPSDVLFTVTAGEVTISTTVTIAAGDTRYAGDPGLVLVVPGLRITNTSVVNTGRGSQVTASVAMMCGCEIGADDADPPEPYWPAYQFGVFAAFSDWPISPLFCTDPKKPSVFTGSMILDVGKGKVQLTAAQKDNSLNCATGLAST
jgi:hypothetical protein